jgi:hypothetical protein
MGRIGYERVSGPLSWERSRAALLAAYRAAAPEVHLRDALPSAPREAGGT